MIKFVKNISIYPYILISLVSIHYWSHYEANGDLSIISSFIKLLPTIYLVLHMIAHINSSNAPRSTAKGNVKDSHWQEQRHLATGVTYGLVFSVIGDLALMVFFSLVVERVNTRLDFTNEVVQIHRLIHATDEYYLIAGIVAFSVAQICYIYALGFKVTRVKNGLCLYAVTAVVSIFVVWDAKRTIKLFTCGYGALLVTSLWRAIDRTEHEDGRPDYKKLTLPVGFIIFFVSDVWIGVSTFLLTDYSASSIRFILFTYYLAQGLIALSSS